jgi:hypothetical protein
MLDCSSLASLCRNSYASPLDSSTHLISEERRLSQNLRIQLPLDLYCSVVDFQAAESGVGLRCLANERVFDVLLNVCYRPEGRKNLIRLSFQFAQCQSFDIVARGLSMAKQSSLTFVFSACPDRCESSAGCRVPRRSHLFRFWRR